MEPDDVTVLDRSTSLGSRTSGTIASDRQALTRPASRVVSTRVWMWAAGVLAIAFASILGWSAVRGHPGPDVLWQDAERAFLAGRWDQARALLSRIERARARTSLDWMLEAQLASASGKTLQAISALGQIPDSHAIAPQALLLAGRLQRQRRCLKKAEACFHRAIELKPGLIEAHKELIYILGIQSRRREVDAEFHALAKLTRLTHHDLFTWALTHFTHWNPDIVQDLDSFITADPDDRYSRLAVVELVLERPEVEDYIKRILAPLPNTDPDALALRINLAFNLGRFQEAETLLAGAPANHSRISRLRGEMALRHHDLDAAIEHFRAALSAEPYDRVSPMQLAQALKLKGDQAGAEALLDRLRRLNRLYSLIIRIRSPGRENQVADLAELGSACEEAGLPAEARGWFTLAISIDPLNQAAQEALYRLKGK